MDNANKARQMIMYHGTPLEQFSEIATDGFLCGPVYLTPNRNTAEDYAANNSPDFVVIAVEVDEALFCADHEFVKCAEDDPIAESLANGSVYIEGSISIESATIYRYEDYEEIA